MQEIFEKIKERLEEKKDLVPVNRLLDDIINDKPLELGQLMAYAEAIEIVNQVAEEYSSLEKSNKLLDSLHEKILKSKFAEEVTEAEIEALVKAKNQTNNNHSLTNDGWMSIAIVNQVEEECNSESVNGV